MRSDDSPGTNQRRTKLLVVLLGFVLFAPVTAWRSFVALREVAQEDAPLFEYDCTGRLAYSPISRLATQVGATNIHRYAEVPEIPAIRLGTLHLLAPIGILEGLDAGRPVEYACLRTAKENLGANAWVFEAIERDELLPRGFGLLSEPIYLLHAGRLPIYLRPHFEQFACMISNVFEGTRAHASGLRAGDLLMGLDGHPHRPGAPCSIAQEIAERDPRRPITLRVVRDQVPLELRALPPVEGESFGCRYRRLPLLDEATLDSVPVVLDRG